MLEVSSFNLAIVDSLLLQKSRLRFHIVGKNDAKQNEVILK